MSLLQMSVYAFTLWMGLYTLERAHQHAGTRYAGMGLVLYAVALAAVSVMTVSQQPLTWQPYIALLTVPLWAAALWHLRTFAQNIAQVQRVIVLAYLAAAFFLLTVLLIVIPQPLLTNTDLLVALSIDVVLMGYAIAWLTVRAEGEALWRDAARSLLLTAGGCLLFGGQVAWLVLRRGTITALDYLLLLEVIASVIVLVVFARHIIRTVDRLIYRDAPALQRSREALQEAADQLARVDPSLEVLTIMRDDPDEFTRLTRRALSHMVHPQRLVASPLLQLPLIDWHPSHDNASDTSLERANVLRQLLSESIAKLKPPHADDEAGITDEWRHYNALYYPYVAGISPYSSRVPLRDLDDETRRVVEWFRAQVPERTFYNWQNAAAALVAQDLREQIHAQMTENPSLVPR